MAPSTLELSELNTKLGRLFMVGIPGKVVDAQTEALIRDYCVGGVILFSRNIEDPVQVAKLCSTLQEKAMQYHGIPLFLAIDQEGGRVARLGAPFTCFPGNTAIGQDPDAVEKASEFARVTAREMTMVGLNMNLAPVVDVRRGEPEKHLMDRTFGEDPETVALLGSTVVKGLQENGVMAVAKHFPGLGKTTLDPHHELPTIELDEKEMNEINLPPFSSAVEAGVSGIMTSHAIYPFLEPELPATLSPRILDGLLRDMLGYQGMIITDDLEMGAIEKKWGVPEGAVQSFRAGADILLICQDQNNVIEAIKILREKMLKEEISFQRLEQSLERIRKVKSTFLKKDKKISMRKIRKYFSV